MANSNNYGIYIGSTHCAIARLENGIPVIKKTDLQKELMPLCVAFNKRGEVLVGDVAVNVLKIDSIRAIHTFSQAKPNAIIGFVRTLGTSFTYEIPNLGKAVTSEELLAECIKKLKSFVDDDIINSVIITVPSKTTSAYQQAMFRAANLASIENVELVAEEIAIAKMYAIERKWDGFYVTFNFGVECFDVTVLENISGNLLIKDTEGDNWLGGKNLDEAIVDQILLPYLQEHYAMDNMLEDSYKREILRNALKPYAEEAKIQLSFKGSHNILSNLGDLPFEDENGDEPEIDIEVTQKDMERVLGPIFQKAIDITLNLLKQNNLKGSDLGALILVGSPTNSPIMRRMLKEQVSENIDTSIDPMTVIAKGAILVHESDCKNPSIDSFTIDNIREELILYYSNNPSMGKVRFINLLTELNRIDDESIPLNEMREVYEFVKSELIKWM